MMDLVLTSLLKVMILQAQQALVMIATGYSCDYQLGFVWMYHGTNSSVHLSAALSSNSNNGEAFEDLLSGTARTVELSL